MVQQKVSKPQGGVGKGTSSSKGGGARAVLKSLPVSEGAGRKATKSGTGALDRILTSCRFVKS
eukprot:2744346-Pyramimonas_sp.AAC.2